MHSYRKLLRKNLLYIAFPVVLVLSALLLLLLQTSRLEMFTFREMEESKTEEMYYKAGQRNVVIHFNDLKSAGFSQMSGDKKSGEYFYHMEDGRIKLVLLTTSTAEKYRAGKMNQKPIYVRIVKDEVTVRHFEGEYAETLGIGQEELEGIGSPYVFDETEYPRIRILILRIASYAISGLLGALMIYVILAMIHPAFCFEAWSLKQYGKVSRMIRRLDREMGKKLRFHQDNVTVTENYLIVSYISRIDVVRIDDIKYLSKHVEKRRRGLAKPIHVYRLTASNADDLFFEADFFDEEIINDVIYYMRGEPLLEYEEQIRKEKEEEEDQIADRVSLEEKRQQELEEAKRELDELFGPDEE